MSLLDTVPLASIEESHLQILVANGVGESLDLEFKAAIYGGSDDDKREFLKDVTALANTSGGHIVMGIEEKGGTAVALRPISAISADSEKLRLESILLASIEPRIVGVALREVEMAGGFALVVRVPRSWNPPHRVTFKGANRYYLRHSSGVYEPSVDQLRAVFLGGAEMERRLMEFRLERLARLQTGGRGFALHARGQLVVQAIPLAEGSFVIPSTNIATAEMPPPGATSFSWRYNLEGLLLHSVAQHGVGVTTAYTQIFRDGRMEMARGGYVRERQGGDSKFHFLAVGPFVADMVRSVSRCVLGAVRHGASYPMAIMVSLLDADGTRLPASAHSFEGAEELDRRDLLFAPLVIEGAADPIWSDEALLPVLDALWNAYGYERCNQVRDMGGQWVGIPDNWG